MRPNNLRHVIVQNSNVSEHTTLKSDVHLESDDVFKHNADSSSRKHTSEDTPQALR